MSLARHSRFVSPVSGVLLGALYGVFARLVFSNGPRMDKAGPVFAALSLAFLLVVPAALGFLTIALGSEKTRRSVVRWIFLPWVSCLLQMAVVVALAWEGAICIVLATPVYFTMASLGGVVAGIVARAREAARPPVMFVSAALLLPFLLAPVEDRIGIPTVERAVTNETSIHADAATVWKNVARVPAIDPKALRFSAFRLIGIPRPIEASLDRDGLGALRTASFSGGIVFHERITAWEPGRRLAFDIAVDPSSIRPDVLDEHVKVGTSSFDVLTGEFVLVPVSPKETRLVLSSRHRLATRLNLYASFWTDAVMRDLQVTICDVIKARAEASAASAAPSSSR